jgi:hypothetical protein
MGGRIGGYATGEITLAKEVVPQPKPGMLCLADRFFFGFALCSKAHTSGCELLWRVRKQLRLARLVGFLGRHQQVALDTSVFVYQLEAHVK